MRSRVKIFDLILITALVLVTAAGCSSSSLDQEFDEYTGTITNPNLGKQTLSANTIFLKVWFNEGKVEGSGKAVIDDISQFAGDTTFTDTYNLKFQGTYDAKTGLLNGLVAVTGGNACKSNCAGTSNSTYNHSSYWQAQVVSGKIVNGKISAYPDFKTSTFLFEAAAAKLNK
jgi:hypothetical protein